MQQIELHFNQLQLHAIYSQCTCNLREYVRHNPGVPLNIKTILKNTIWIEVIISQVVNSSNKFLARLYILYHMDNTSTILIVIIF